ncbi:PAS domain-containing protein [Falsiroseomonas tokyonensis]|uniref:PAS domain-containing protein n=1 Tax=Falsiroseomonas tokyonensis TaxID=430521 RepID=A0ABV7BX31_9PROT|nr:PAS domain-containing protein [Falsiroseomonas tokyonensis]MBU8540005.1 hypothetical protein [Falsiroseomonas tokyonensis]
MKAAERQTSAQSTEAGGGEAALRESPDQVVDGVVTIDARNNVVYMNPAASRLWGWNPRCWGRTSPCWCQAFR